ncbi:MAG: hypothetical protein D6687_12020 [Acidobacteria bacterium]|jgi:uncharacterized membrane protein|nr:MAG: hypothetical protein D6687_12020 [Acidobacteriota bacterium]GIU82439.1 MAG: hypothetical protein KatS3mg006_1503 [Pyrinomonadaceae bacterium]
MESLRIRKVEISVTDCYKKSWDSIKKHYWILFIVTFLALVIAQMSLGILLGAVFCGAFVCILQALKGENVVFEDFLKGFRLFFPSFLPTVLFILPVPIVGIAVPFAMIFFDSNSDLSYLLLKIFVIEFALVFIIVCLHTLLTFSFLLIADKGVSGWQSILISSKAVWQNLNVVVKIFLAGFVLAIIGNLAFCVGIYFVMPLILTSIAFIYKEIFYENRTETDSSRF